MSVKDPCHCDRHEWDHICETTRYTLQEIPCAECCGEFPCELTCECGVGSCCDETTDATKRDGEQETPLCQEMPFKRGGCRCLCDHLTKLQPGADCTEHLCEINEPCGLVRVDLRHAVPLACVELVPDPCNQWVFGKQIDACGPRRLVKRNGLLFDLIRGCDLTRICDIGWKDWHRRDAIPFKDFSLAFGKEGKGETEYVTNKFTVEFSRPVRLKTLQPDCFAITVMSVETEGGWWQVFRVPIVGLEMITKAGDPPNHVRGAKIVVDGAWVEDGLRGRRSVFLAGETTVEIEVRGDLIIDCNGQPVDANAVGLLAYPTGNGSPGGTFFSSFRVAAPEPDRPSSKESTDRH